jgi:hypothetical protein
MAQGSSQPLTEMSTRNFPGGKAQTSCKADNLTAICEPIVYKIFILIFGILLRVYYDITVQSDASNVLV